ncbi:MAG: replication initiation factor domain-containing protein [Candidatus Sedimenticola sp. (ex Thyasira tokunagai)]
MHGWLRSYDLGASSGKFAIGGQRGRALLSLPGSACAKIRREAWSDLISIIRDEYGGRITRWDGAADDHEGIHSLEWALKEYESGGFKSGGNRPKATAHGDWINNEGRGRTLYIGSRKNGKLVRIYEKGNQLGDPSSPWVRWEVELRSKDRQIPWEVLLEPGPYVAGAYPCMSWVHDEASRIKTYKETAAISYDFLTHCARQAYGRHLNVMLAVEKSPEKVLEKLIRSGKPARLDMPVPPEYLEQIREIPKG